MTMPAIAPPESEVLPPLPLLGLVVLAVVSADCVLVRLVSSDVEVDIVVSVVAPKRADNQYDDP